MTHQDGRQAGLLLAILLVTGACAWWLSSRPSPTPVVEGLTRLPAVLNDWKAIDIEIDRGVTDMLRADANLQRAYLHPHGYSIYVYVGYYGSERGGVPEHTPDVCYPAQGWQIVERDRIRIGGRDGMAAQEFVVEKQGERRLVHFWYRTRDSTGITSTLMLQVRHFWSRLATNRGDGALVRLSTQIRDGDLLGARGRLLAMDTTVDRALAGVWPVEARTAGSGEPVGAVSDGGYDPAF